MNHEILIGLLPLISLSFTVSKSTAVRKVRVEEGSSVHLTCPSVEYSEYHTDIDGDPNYQMLIKTRGMTVRKKSFWELRDCRSSFSKAYRDSLYETCEYAGRLKIRSHLHEDGSLSINNVSIMDAGLFVCNHKVTDFEEERVYKTVGKMDLVVVKKNKLYTGEKCGEHIPIIPYPPITNEDDYLATSVKMRIFMSLTILQSVIIVILLILRNKCRPVKFQPNPIYCGKEPVIEPFYSDHEPLYESIPFKVVTNK